jgi:hypothetical protein
MSVNNIGHDFLGVINTPFAPGDMRENQISAASRHGCAYLPSLRESGIICAFYKYEGAIYFNFFYTMR